MFAGESVMTVGISDIVKPTLTLCMVGHRRTKLYFQYWCLIICNAVIVISQKYIQCHGKPSALFKGKVKMGDMAPNKTKGVIFVVPV